MKAALEALIPRVYNRLTTDDALVVTPSNEWSAQFRDSYASEFVFDMTGEERELSDGFYKAEIQREPKLFGSDIYQYSMVGLDDENSGVEIQGTISEDALEVDPRESDWFSDTFGFHYNWW